MFTLLQSIENAKTGVFAGYVDSGYVRVVVDDEPTVDLVANWQPVNSRGDIVEWPARRTQGLRPVTLTTQISVDVESEDMHAVCKSVDDSLDGLALITRGTMWELS